MTASMLARVSPDVQRHLIDLAVLDLALEDELGNVHSWRKEARPEQLPPDGPWSVLYYQGGRGSGKTWPAAHMVAEWTQDFPGGYGVVAPTFADARDTCIEGPSGLLAAFGTNRAEVEAGKSSYVRNWNRSIGELYLGNGSQIYIDGADDGALRIQGKNLRGLWFDEPGLCKNGWRLAWEESIRYAVRIQPAHIVVSGTPKRGHPLVRLLIDDSTVVKRRLKTLDNIGNLDELTVRRWMELYGGTALGRQELEGELLDDVPGAVWQRPWIELFRLFAQGALEFIRVSVGIDPAITSTEGADQTGMVAAAAALVSRDWCEELFSARKLDVPDSHGAGSHEHYFVLADESGKMTPSEWSQAAIRLYRRLKADRIVGEVNRGGEMIEHTLRTVDPDIPFKAVRATRGKAVRAEPVAALYQQGKVHHLGAFPEVEDEMCGYVPGDLRSPDRMDALVWALTDLAIKDEPGLLGALASQVARREEAARQKEAA